jgi:hypothetical protein
MSKSFDHLFSLTFLISTETLVSGANGSTGERKTEMRPQQLGFSSSSLCRNLGVSYMRLWRRDR